MRPASLASDGSSDSDPDIIFICFRLTLLIICQTLVLLFNLQYVLPYRLLFATVLQFILVWPFPEEKKSYLCCNEYNFFF